MTKNENLNQLNNSSPFDGIRQFDEQGQEYWTARELMPLLGYSRWNEFKPVIERATFACKNTGNDVEMHFSGSTLKSIGRPGQDYKLSRYGGYLTAMNGDPRKPEIAAAQSYFVVKTREAETQTQLKAMTQIQLLAALAQQLAEQEQHLLQQQQQQTEILHRLKAVEVEQDRVNTPCGHKYSVVGFANLQGLEISVKEAGTKGRKASALCRKQGIEIERIHDPRFGKVGLYPQSILVEVFKVESNSVFLKPLCWTEALSSLRDRITALTGYKFRIVIGNQYRTGTDSIGWHSDNEPSMGFNPAIASVSLGSCRKFQIKPRNGKPTDFWLEHGSLLVMHPGCQSTHLHQVPKTNKVVSTRINLTFRPHTGGGR